MLGGGLTTLQGCTLQQGKVGVVSGTFRDVNVVECVEDGDIDITWKDGTATPVTMTSGWVNPVECKSITINSGRFNVARV